MIAILWQFDVRKGREKEFERFYGADGEWTLVNRHSRSYLGSSFLRDQTQSSRLHVDRILERDARSTRSTKAFHHEQRQALEAHRADFVERVEPMGVFTALDVPDRFGPTWSRRS
jgi:hypothetical protein